MHVTVAEVQQWLEQTKLDLGNELDSELEASQSEVVLSQLRSAYATVTWTDETTTPVLVRKIISMLIAAWYYRRSYSDQIVDGVSYADRLESSALALLGGLVEGSSSLGEDGATQRDSTSYPVFWPTDTATTIADEEGPDADGAAVLAFRMGKVF